MRALRGEKVFREKEKKALAATVSRSEGGVYYHRSHDLGCQEEETRFVRGTTLFLSRQIGLRTMRRIRTHGCVYSFRLDACIWKRHRCRMRHVRVHVPDLCEPRPLTSRLLVDARTFDISTNLKFCSSSSLKRDNKTDRFLIWKDIQIEEWMIPPDENGI